MSVRLRADIDPVEIHTLIAILREQGIHYLVASVPPPPGASIALDPVELLLRLASCNDPLVEHVVIALFILHPELAPAAHCCNQIKTIGPATVSLAAFSAPPEYSG